ncbi:ribonucleases P/MRP protein subunit POP1 isoform 2-T2 [Pholidichthys leucotaenia]
MSASKVKMREKKLRNQPVSVQYSSDTRDKPAPAQGGPSDFRPSSEKLRKPSHECGWVRGHQRGGECYSKEMPKFINAGAFARVRAAEVRAMLKAVTMTTASSHVFEALPKHMRRRAMSHNTKRLPHRLRDVANKMREKSFQGASKKKDAPKSKSRKACRRHGNLLLEFNRRQRKNIWLETHIWHAKRFHMVKKWGYCLGDRPTYKCYRPCYRAMSSHCLLQDLSYYCCIELQGEEDKLLTALSQLTSKETGPTFAAALCLSGCRQGSVVVYRGGQYPSQPLGPITFLWRPRSQGSTHRQLWIWAHPTLKQDLLPELQAVCQCCEVVLPLVEPVVTPAEVNPGLEPESAPVNTPETESEPRNKRKWSCKSTSGPPAKKILGDGTRSPSTPVTWRSSSTGILINDLTMEIVRYRLIGPQAHSVLSETLEAATDCEEVNKSQSSPFWWPQHCIDENKMKLHQQQADIFNLLKGVYSSGELPSGTVLGLTVDDPRLTLPRNIKALPPVQQVQEVDEEKRRELMLRGVPEHCCQSFLWEQSVRDNATHNKISEQELNHKRSAILVPGSRLSPTPLQGQVPILLVHQPGKQVGNEMSSWGCGWDLLLPKGWGMAFWVPLVYRGIRTGGLHMSLKHSQNKGAPHFPHDYPDCPAGLRFQEELEAELLEKFKRNKKSLRLLSAWCRPTTSKGQRLRRVGEAPPLSSSAVMSFIDAHQMSLVWVRLSLLSKGKPERHAMLCVPTAEDMKSLDKDRGNGGPQEPPHRDNFKSKVKRRKKGSKKAAASSSNKPEGSGRPSAPDPQSSPQASPDLVLGLWPDPLPSVISHCSRVMLGWVTQGDFSLSAGCGEALGFVSVTGLLNTLLGQPMEHRGKLLLRNPTSLHYRFAKVNIEI